MNCEVRLRLLLLQSESRGHSVTVYFLTPSGRKRPLPDDLCHHIYKGVNLLQSRVHIGRDAQPLIFPGVTTPTVRYDASPRDTCELWSFETIDANEADGTGLLRIVAVRILTPGSSRNRLDQRLRR